MMKRAAWGLAGLLAVVPAGAWARGVTPYLPLNLEPEIEAQIERVLILADKPVMRRPIAAATVLDALPRACQADEALCQRVGRYLARCTHSSDLTHASTEGGPPTVRTTPSQTAICRPDQRPQETVRICATRRACPWRHRSTRRGDIRPAARPARLAGGRVLRRTDSRCQGPNAA
jgi:hypothetical protein